MMRFLFRALWIIVALFSSLNVMSQERLTLLHSLSSVELSAMLLEVVEREKLPIDIVYLDNDLVKGELMSAALSDKLPDMMILPNDYLGLPIPFKPLPTQWFDEIQPLYMNSDLLNSRRGVPVIGGNQLLLYYNKNFVSEPITDFAQLIDTDFGLPTGVSTIRWSVREPYWLQPFFSRDRSSFFAAGLPQLDRAEMWRALATYRRLIDGSNMDISCDYSCAFNDFLMGKTAYTVNGDWAMRELRAMLGNNLGVTSLPKMDGYDLHPYYGSQIFAVPSTSVLPPEKLLVIERFLAAMLSDSFQRQLWLRANLIPTKLGVVDSLEDPLLSDMQSQIESGVYMPHTSEMVVVWESIGVALTRFLDGFYDEREAAQFMQMMTINSLREQRRENKHAR